MGKEKGVVLVVDDSAHNLSLMTTILESNGYMTLQAVNGKSALRIAKNAGPDLILLDIRMPEMDGYEVCSQLQADDELKMIPVIFLSGLTDAFEKIKAYKSGGADYIEKPYVQEEVVAKAATHIELYRLRQACNEQKG